MSWHGFNSIDDAPKEVEHDGRKHVARPVPGREVEMDELRDGERCAWGDGATFHIRMMPVPDAPPAAISCSDATAVEAARKPKDSVNTRN